MGYLQVNSLSDEDLQSNLKQKPRDVEEVKVKEDVYRKNQRKNLHPHHRAKERPLMQKGEKVWIRDQNSKG